MFPDIGVPASSADFIAGVASSLFFVAYAIPQVFTTLRINSMGIRKIFAFAFSAWGIITIVTGFVQNVPEIYALRFILGLAEAPFMQVPCSLWASGLSRRSVVLQIPF